MIREISVPSRHRPGGPGQAGSPGAARSRREPEQQVEGGLLDRHVEVGSRGLVRVGDERRLGLVDRNRLGQVTRRYAVALSRGRARAPGRRGRCRRSGRRGRSPRAGGQRAAASGGRPAAGRLEGVIPPGPLIRRLVSGRIGPRRLSGPYRLGGPGRLGGPRRRGWPPGWRRTLRGGLVPATRVPAAFDGGVRLMPAARRLRRGRGGRPAPGGRAAVVRHRPARWVVREVAVARLAQGVLAGGGPERGLGPVRAVGLIRRVGRAGLVRVDGPVRRRPRFARGTGRPGPIGRIGRPGAGIGLPFPLVAVLGPRWVLVGPARLVTGVAVAHVAAARWDRRRPSAPAWSLASGVPGPVSCSGVVIRGLRWVAGLSGVVACFDGSVSVGLNGHCR